jgi:hypothetical protein
MKRSICMMFKGLMRRQGASNGIKMLWNLLSLSFKGGRQIFVAWLSARSGRRPAFLIPTAMRSQRSVSHWFSGCAPATRSPSSAPDQRAPPEAVPKLIMVAGGSRMSDLVLRCNLLPQPTRSLPLCIILFSPGSYRKRRTLSDLMEAI